MARTNRTVQELVKLASPTRRSEGSTQGTATPLDPGCTDSRFSLALIRHPAEPPYTGARAVDRASAIVPFLHQLLAHEPSECLDALFLTARRHPIGHAIPFRGTLSQCRVEPRQPLLMALAVNASGLALLHYEARHMMEDLQAGGVDRLELPEDVSRLVQILLLSGLDEVPWQVVSLVARERALGNGPLSRHVPQAGSRNQGLPHGGSLGVVAGGARAGHQAVEDWSDHVSPPDGLESPGSSSPTAAAGPAGGSPPAGCIECGKITAMPSAKTLTIDTSGRLVIPKTIREKAGLRPGEALEIRYRDGHVEIEPAPTPVRIEKRGRVAVAVAEERVPALSAEEVEQTRGALRNRHAER